MKCVCVCVWWYLSVAFWPLDPAVFALHRYCKQQGQRVCSLKYGPVLTWDTWCSSLVLALLIVLQLIQHLLIVIVTLASATWYPILQSAALVLRWCLIRDLCKWCSQYSSPLMHHTGLRQWAFSFTERCVYVEMAHIACTNITDDQLWAHAHGCCFLLEAEKNRCI